MKTYQEYLEIIGEFGVVTQVHDTLVTIQGLPTAFVHEVVLFENGQIGEVFSITEDSVIILNFSSTPMGIGVKVVRTGKVMSIPVGQGLLGMAIDPLGNPMSTAYAVPKLTEERPIDNQPSGISTRSKIKKPVQTGITIIDLIIPLGRGQRQLIIGDRKTGKTSLAMDILTNQLRENTIIIYAAIGKKKNDIKELEEYFISKNMFRKSILIATSSYDAPTLIYLTPLTAMTIAEYFRDLGFDTIVVFDDLSTHAKFYREISLLAKNFPGRDSYPGDIFYLHARLLERAGNFKGAKGDVAITCLPMVETVEWDITGYIATNIMSMTDGFIFFDTNIVYQGRRPAVNTTLSITRVGKQIQTPLQQSINRELLLLFAQYDKAQSLSHFGAEISDEIKQVLHRGDLFYEFLNQPFGLYVSTEVQVTLFALLWQNALPVEKIHIARASLSKHQEEANVKAMFQTFVQATSASQLLDLVLQKQKDLLFLCE